MFHGTVVPLTVPVALGSRCLCSEDLVCVMRPGSQASAVSVTFEDAGRAGRFECVAEVDAAHCATTDLGYLRCNH